ncbi:MAG: hypothetical protein OXC19_15920 [Bryobacterales bacterium]|nr:hypothetical protein [Bryobacterales bacterium]
MRVAKVELLPPEEHQGTGPLPVWLVRVLEPEPPAEDSPTADEREIAGGGARETVRDGHPQLGGVAGPHGVLAPSKRQPLPGNEVLCGVAVIWWTDERAYVRLQTMVLGIQTLRGPWPILHGGTECRFTLHSAPALSVRGR